MKFEMVVLIFIHSDEETIAENVETEYEEKLNKRPNL